MAEPHFSAIQAQFTAHMRDPEQCPGPADVEERRLRVYRDLLYRNVEGFMAKGFPVLRSLLVDSHWHALVRDYYARHRAHTPLFPRMPQEFVHYLASERADPRDPPYLAELAHYEWLEAEVLFDTREVDSVAVDATCDLEEGCGVPNPLLRTHCYRYPVHRIGSEFQPQTAPAAPTYLAVYRRRDDSVGFMELNAVAARLLELVLNRPATPLRTQLETIARELAHPDPAVVMDNGRRLLDTFLRKELLLGTRQAANPSGPARI